jgi:hypothetical protein
MFGTSDFSSFEERGPAWFPTPSIEHVPADPNEQLPLISQVYAAAWTMAQRDHELDMLFNPDYYRGRDI